MISWEKEQDPVLLNTVDGTIEGILTPINRLYRGDNMLARDGSITTVLLLIDRVTHTDCLLANGDTITVSHDGESGYIGVFVLDMATLEKKSAYSIK